MTGFAFLLKKNLISTRARTRMAELREGRKSGRFE